MFKTHPVDLYDFVYSWKNYAQESREIRAAAADYGFCEGQSVLELACGTGRYLDHFSDCRQIGIDLCEHSLAIASRRIPNGLFIQGNMADFELAEPVDVILCVFGAYGYLLTYEAQQQALQSIFKALKPGGILLLQPWVEPGAFKEGETFLQTYRSPNLMISRMVTPRRIQNTSVLDFYFLVARSGFKNEWVKCQDILLLSEYSQVLTDLLLFGFELLAQKQMSFSDRPLYVLRRRA